MTAFLWKLLWWALGLFGVGRPESESHRAERLTRDAERAKQDREVLRGQIAADQRRRAAEDRLAKMEQALKGKDKVKPGKPLFGLLLTATLISTGLVNGCAAKVYQAPPMSVVCPAIPLPQKPDITVPEPDGSDRYCFSEQELQAISDYAKTMRALIEAYNEERTK